ncbi:ComEC/Rec2 family competence protein [Vineibacter terrae]|uniref:ComEC/Rec2 family competence protein n=1 Tax=Vineibacter terrae TaxID=2586908 RepID=UPI002E2FA5F7|nr:ComEC/Rec2 family competence protein [Vineibacter terrae]HEX2885843.1 ComEC/Rec2 family competence protein [Vineibacter terrae]
MAGLPARALAALRRRLEAERERWILWLPVLLGSGIALYFELPAEPPRWVGVAIVGLGVLLAWSAMAGVPVRPLALAVIAFGAGFGVATWRTAQMAAPVLARAYGPAAVEGRVVEVTLLPGGRRLVLDDVVLRGLRREETPARVRVSLTRGGGERLATGDRITLIAALSPPPGPAAPGAFDFQRFAWFARIGAVGYAVGRPTVIQAGQPSGIIMWIDELRRRLSARLVAVLPGDAGALAAALVAGDQSGISKDTMQAMRDSGLAHLLSISGLHISFAALLVMGLVRYGLAAVPRLALRYPIKKWAALAGVLGALFYTMLAGAPVPAQRSFLMLAIVLLAVLTDRTALTMRLVCWAAVVILLLLPESLVGASFQLSFAAVVALVAAWEAWRPWQVRREAGQAPTFMGRVGGYLSASLFTTLVASVATAGFSAYHFNRLSLVGILANLLAVPLTGIWVMPWGLAALLLLPFGGEALALVPMGWGIDAIMWVAREAASWPAAATMTPAMPGASLWLLTLGGLWLCLWRTSWRWWGLAPVALAMALGPLHRPPDILVSGDARLVGVRTAHGGMLLSSGRIERFTGESWVRRAGVEQAGLWPVGTESADGRLRCDALGCIYRRDGWRVAIVSKVDALVDDCDAVDMILSLVPVRRRCPAVRQVVDRFDIWRNGAHAVWLQDDGDLRIETTRQARGERPWVPRPETRPRPADAANDGRGSPGRREERPRRNQNLR